MSFDDIASIYDETRTIPIWILNKFYERIFEEIRLNSNLNILDAGIGTGRIARPLLNLDVHLVGIDISKEMLRKMMEKLEKSFVSSQVSLILGDVNALPFREHSFDLVISVNVLHLIKKWRKAIEETRRVLKIDGLFSVAGHVAPELISKTGQKYFELRKSYSSQGLSGKSIWILNKVLKYEKAGFLEHILKMFRERNDFWGSGGQAYLRKQAFSMKQYIIKWQEVIGINQIFNRLDKRIISSQWRIPREIHEKVMFELSKWKNEEIRKNGSFEKIRREFGAVMVRFR
jgi:ubiquinone/menaquinone biosynthesis C-methylase UbiE